MTPEEMRALIEAHKGLGGTEIIDPTVTSAGGFKRPNPQLKVKYVFGDGEYVVARQDPETKQFSVLEQSTGVKRANDPVKADTSPTTRDFPDGSLRQYNPNSKQWDTLEAAPREATVVRPTNDPEAPAATERVPAAQATYDRQASQDAVTNRRNAENDAAQRVNEATANRLVEIRAQVEQNQLTLQQAIAEVNKTVQQQQLALDAERNQLTRRGQDISAGVSQRGQDMSYTSALAGDSTTLMHQMLEGYVSPSQAARFQAYATAINTGNRGPLTLPPMQADPYPIDPRTFPSQAAAQAGAQMPSRFVLPAG